MLKSFWSVNIGQKKHLITGYLLFIIFFSTNSVICFAQKDASKTSISDNIFENTLVRMTWPEVKAAADKKAIVLVPISIVEEHGPHMDLSIDIMLGSVISSMIKNNLEKDNIPAVIAPPFYWGISFTTDFLPGTFNIKESTMKLLLTEIVENMAGWGFEKFYFMSFHGDPAHNLAITRIAASIDSSGIAKVYDISKLPETADTRVNYPEVPGMFSPDYHAGANESKLVWKFEPSIIRMDKVSSLKPQNNFAPLGYVGDPANFMNSKFDEFVDSYSKSLSKKIENHLSTINKNNK